MTARVTLHRLRALGSVRSSRRSRLVTLAIGAVLALSLAPIAQAANQAGEQALLTHVPSPIAGTCASIDAQAGSIAQVSCHPGGDIGEADYLLYSDNASMDAAFDSHVAVFPEANGTDCSVGASTGNYTINGNPAGRLLCAADNQGTVFIEWTDDRFGIITVGVSANGSYASLYDWWVNDAGPVEGNGQTIPTAEPTFAVQSPGAPTPVAPTPGQPTSASQPTPASSAEPGSGPKLPGTPYSRITGANIHQVIFAGGIDANANSPIGISDVFKTGTAKIFALIAWDVIDIGAPLDVTLFQDNRLVSTTEVIANNPAKQAPSVDLDGGFAVPLAPSGGFAAGHYAVELDYHNLPEQVATFEVNDTGDGAPQPGVLGSEGSGTNPDLGPIPYADPSQVLVVTRSSILRSHMGADTDAVLAAAAKVGTVHDLNTELGDNTRPVPLAAAIKLVQDAVKAGSYKYLLILGNEDTVPFGHVKLPDSVNYTDEMDPGIPGDYVVSDDPYANLDGDPIQVPDIAVARIPTSDDAQLMLKQLGENQSAAAGAFSLVNEVRRSVADGPLSIVNAVTPVTLYYSPPTLTEQVPQTNEAKARFIYILLHGSGSLTDTWYGEIQKWTPLDPGNELTEYHHEENDFTHGISVPSAGAPGAFVDVGACFGAYTLDSLVGDTHKTRDNSLALAFLASGARAFIADTYISESFNVDPGEKPIGRTGWEILLWQGIQKGMTPIDAYLSAKQQAGQLIAEQYASGNTNDSLNGDTNFLALHEMVYLGRP